MNKYVPNLILMILFTLGAVIGFSQTVGDYRSNATGNWNNTGTWQRLNSISPITWATPTAGQGYPGQFTGTGTVTIRNTHAPRINNDVPNAIGALVIENGGNLEYDKTGADDLVVTGNVTINNGGILDIRGGGGSSLGPATLTVGGNVVNNGTLDCIVGNQRVNFIFNGSSNQIISGTGGTTDFNLITVNNTGATNNIVEVTSTNFTVPTGFLTLTDGIFKVSGSFTLNNTFFNSAGYTIPSGTGLWLNNSSATVTAQNSAITMNGLIRVDAGDYNIGTTDNDDLRYGDNAQFIMGGGTMDINGLFRGNATGNNISFDMSGGTLTLGISAGWSDNTYSTFDIRNTGSTFNMSGGTIVLKEANGGSGLDYRNAASTYNITGGTVQFGNASTPTGTVDDFDIVDGTRIPSLSILDLGAATPTVTLSNTTNIYGDVLIGSNTTLTANNQNINVSGNSSAPGNWTNNGSFSAGTNTVTFNNSAASVTQTIGGTAATAFNNVTVNPASTSNVTIATNPTFAGNLSVLTGTLNNGGFNLTLAANRNFSVSNGATFNLTGTSTMVAVSGTGTKTFQPTSTVNYAGANQTVTAETYGHLIFSGSGTKTLPGTTTTVQSNFTTSGSAATTAASASINVTGDVTLGSSGAFNAGAATHTISGSWYKNNATAFTPSTSTIYFSGSGDDYEVVGGTQDNTFYDFTIDGSTLSFERNVTVSNTLTLTSKLIYLNNFNLTLSNASGLSWCNCGDSYAVTNGSGRFIRTIGSAGTYNFPIGDFAGSGSVIAMDATIFNPAVFTWAGAPGVTSVSSHFTGDQLANPTGLTSDAYGPDLTPITQFLNNGYWDFTGVGTPGTYDLTLTSDGVTNMGALATQHAIFQNTTTGPTGWGDAGTVAIAGTIAGGVINPLAKNVSGFGFFGIGRSDEYVLPIVLTEFEGSNIGTANVLTWSTALEMNNDYFTIERSLDGHNYESVGTIDGAGNSDQILHYTFTDNSPFLGTNYYRLKQTDFNGAIDYSDVISIRVDGSFEMGYPYPNPVVNDVHFNITSENTGVTNLRIMDISGKIVYEELINVEDGMQTLTVNMDALESGIYISEIQIDGIKYHKPIVKQ